MSNESNVPSNVERIRSRYRNPAEIDAGRRQWQTVKPIGEVVIEPKSVVPGVSGTGLLVATSRKGRTKFAHLEAMPRNRPPLLGMGGLTKLIDTLIAIREELRAHEAEQARLEAEEEGRSDA